MDIKIRKIEIEDAKAVRDISAEGLGYDCELALVQKKISEMDASREAAFAAVVDNNVIGYIHVERYDVLYCETMANVLGLSVFKAYHKKGIGKALLLTAEDWAKQNGIKIMRLNSGFNRTDAHGFYQHLGYISEKDQKRFVKKL